MYSDPPPIWAKGRQSQAEELDWWIVFLSAASRKAIELDPMSGPAIEIEYLKKCYGRFEALAGVALSVPRGSVFGLLGPNGAGKSTLVKSLLTIVRPTE